ncbi:MAG: hypothetical protein KDA44_10390 [Planctomycetales bacterium]|nr:hypothetical protein [Planctomycetales bacterium]
MAMDHDGVFEAGKAYSHKAIALILGKAPRWVLQNMLATGPEERDSATDDLLQKIPTRKVGNLHMAAGANIIRWIERGDP